MNIQEEVLSQVYDTPGNSCDIQTISKWTKLKPKSIYKALDHLKNRGAVQTEREVFIEKGSLPIVKLKIKITPKKLSKSLWILNKMNYKK